uniref:Uncharacterized protein n=1 Tax=Rhipicephalus zambeziensis TaxID=60191 RepID=A0A224YIC9_9ACAR
MLKNVLLPAALFIESSTVLELFLQTARALQNPLPMADKYVLMSAILIVIIISRTSGYFTCQGREGQCGPDRRPNCLKKNEQPYFQCTPKRQPCESAWLSCCPRNALTCYRPYVPTYCDCFCLHQQQTKPKPGRRPGRSRPRTRF